MRYYEVFIASGRYHSGAPLTYSSEEPLGLMTAVTVPLRNRSATGFVIQEVGKPNFSVKPIKALVSKKPLPQHCLPLARWLEEYYIASLGDALSQFAPSKPSVRQIETEEITHHALPNAQLEFESPLTADQKNALKQIRASSSTTSLLHGATGTGKTRVYLELARETIKRGHSVMLLTPEIALTTQLAAAAKQFLQAPVFVLHSQLTDAKRKEIWLAILESGQPVVVVGPRSALFAPVHNLGLVVLDEAHEPAYKQEQNPRYHAVRAASQLGLLTSARVVLGSATPSITDYYLAKEKGAVITMNQPALGDAEEAETEIVDIKERSNFSRNPNLSNQLIDVIKATLAAKKQVIIYLNRRGSARIILCNKCGWQLLCPNCDIPLVYHGDTHSVRCHICGYHQDPPKACPVCANTDIIYKSIGTKALADSVIKLFPQSKVQRFDSDNAKGERLDELYSQLLKGEIDILVGTQLLAKGLDLPKLGLVGIITAETTLALPDYSSEERAYQLLYQVIGRVGRGHGKGKVVVQSYEPNSLVVQAATQRDWQTFYKHVLAERQQFRFPPFSYLAQLVCRRATLKGAEQASQRLFKELVAANLQVEVIGPAPSFYARRGKYHYWQIVLKSKDRRHLEKLVKLAPADWVINLDPVNLL